LVSTSVSKRPIWLVEAAFCVTAAPPTIPAQGGIVRQAICVIHVLVPGQPSEDGLAKLRDQRVTAILTRPGIGENLSS
jgi:hypothetical protein